ncbi:serine/threonine-protein phosphatase 4 regulatory subunit 1-like isoform X2 [Mya arenaria]|uniref:serine/threonine-protein phosphatase 4 regulatory subunit 1-like isoform X2 n=1 Tax=Mya arenaria TaxID=6604 RepID=UPI0022E565DA|nr:serine/threonine-protein phosphatase 4 regulatory subunit 1-like isoform X2 [Mya arenaria]
MADIDLYQQDSDDGAEDGYGLDDGLDCDEPFGADDNLSPLQKLEKYMESDNVYTRQMVAKGLLDTLRAVGDSEEQTTAVLTAMVKLSEDSDPIVRSELMEQIPHIAVYCHDNEDIFQNAISVYILPMVVRYLDDANNQVRKTSQAALLVLLEQELITRDHIEEQVVSVILELAGVDSLDEYRTEAVALMSKMAPLLGKDMTERVFLDRFCEMCCDPLFHVRKVCAANFGDFCSVVSQHSTEKKLLPKFFYLCEDGVWGVRKACAECFMTVSCTCSSDVRKAELAHLFVSLLCDQSRWVRMAAFQQLGPFISTFADSDSTGMYVEEDGTLVFKPTEKMLNRGNEDEETVVSEIIDCDTKTLPDLIPATVSEGNQSSCDITANLSAVDNDSTSENNAEDQSGESGPLTSFMDISEEQGSNQSETGMVQRDDNQSTEEKRAEFYFNNEPKETVKEDEPNEDKSISGTDDSAQNNSNCNNDNHQKDINVDVEESSTDVVKTSPEQSESNENNVERTLETQNVNIQVDSTSDFDSFNYWRTPIPAVELGLDILQESSTDEELQARRYFADDNEQHADLCAALSNTLDDLSVCDNQATSVIEHSSPESNEIDLSNIAPIMPEGGMETTMPVIDGVIQDFNIGHIDSNLLLSLLPLADLGCGEHTFTYMDSDFSAMSPSSLRDVLLDDATLAQQQNIVPQSLLENYLGMIDPSRAQTVDTEITKYCAYNLPAVAYTLGRENWHCIKNLYETLAADMQWKVRRTLAFSIHELALILGEEITHRDLVPVFDGFLKDLDEVRIGILRHLADFLRLLRRDVRRQYLIKIQDFMNVDNNRNWRFRQEVAEQLVLISELYSASEISDHLLPMALSLAEDRVAEVRIDAYHLVSVMIKRMRMEGDERLVQYLINQLIGRFAHNHKWARRQIFTQLCLGMVREESLTPEQFAQELLPHLLHMVNDQVPNVRITLAKTMYAYMANEKFSQYEEHPCGQELEEGVSKLQTDQDRDVRFYCSPEAYMETPAYSDDGNSLCDYQLSGL